MLRFSSLHKNIRFQLLSFVLVSIIFQFSGWATTSAGIRFRFTNIRNNGKTDSEIVTYIEQLKDPDERARAEAALELGEIDLNSREQLKKEALQLLVNLLEDKEVEVRANAASALKNMPSEKKVIVPILISVLNDPEPAVRVKVLSALGNVGEISESPKLIEALTHASKDTNLDVRVEALKAIDQVDSIDNAQLTSILLNAFEDKDIEARVAAIQAFHEIAWYEEQSARKILSALISALEDNEEIIRHTASRTLSAAGTSLYGDDGTYFENSEALPVARSFIPALVEVLQKNLDPKIREDIVFAIASIGGPEAKSAVPTLIDLVRTSKDPQVAGRTIDALRRIDLENKEVISTLIEALKVDTGVYAYAGGNTPQNAAHALGELAERLVDKQAKLSNKELIEAISILEQSLEILNDRNDFFASETIARVSRSIESLRLEKSSRWSSAIILLINSHPWILGFPLAATSYMAIFWLRPRWLLLLPSELSIPKTNLKLPVTALRWLKYRPRALDAWIADNILLARKNFLALDTVKQRQIHIPLNELHGNGKSYIEFIYSVFSNKEFCLLIHGLGGTGKTSLACQIAQWSMAEEKEQRLCSYPMIAVLVEQDFDQEVEKEKQLVSAIKGRLERLVMASKTIPDELLDQLLRHRRLLVIIDHLSELSSETKKGIKPSSPDFPVKALIVTSRVKESLDRMQKHKIELPRLSNSAGQLTAFLESYLHNRNKDLLFKSYSAQIEFNIHCNRLIRMAGDRGITVLLAKLYAELMIAQKEGTSIDALPTNVPDVMLSYINELNAEHKTDGFDNYVIQKDAQAIAWACMESNYRPTSIKREAASRILSGGDANARIIYLEDRLQLIQTAGFDQDYVRFSLDPLAEYLAGLHLVKTNHTDLAAWQTFFEKAQEFETDGILGFVQAVSECCQMNREQIPDVVIEKLSILVEPGEVVGPKVTKL